MRNPPGTSNGVHGREGLPGGGEMGERIIAFDWSRSPLGPVETWSPALRMMVRFLLTNRFPLLLLWGPQYVSIYNDAYCPVLGKKHPQALGQPVSKCWQEIWHVLQPLIDTPFNGGPATWNDDLLLEINRHGFVEEAHFTIAYSPVPDETVPSGIGGVLATVHEITGKVVGDRRVVVLRDLGGRSFEAKTAGEACAIAARTLAGHSKDIPFALLYLIDPDQKTARLAGTAGVTPGPSTSPGAGERASPATISLEGQEASASPWPLAETLRRGAPVTVPALSSLLAGRVSPGPWTDPPHTAVVVPIPSNKASYPAGFLVAGISPRLCFDDAYRDFLNLVSSQIATSIASARKYEEERKRAEALPEIDQAKTLFFSSQAKLQAAFDSMTEAIFIGDAEGRLIAFNDEFVRYHRFRDREECSRTIADCPMYLDVWFADGTPAPLEQWAMPRALRGETASNVEYLLRRKETGETWWGSYNFAPIKDKDGNITGAVVAGREITKQKLAEQALHESEERFRQALEAANAGSWKVNLDTGEFSASDRTVELHGLAPGSPMTFELALACVHPEDRAAFETALRHTVETGEHFQQGHRLAQPDGSVRWVISHADRRIEGDQTHLIGLVQDITPQKNAEEALRKNEERMTLALQATQDGIWDWNIETDEVFYSSRWKTMLGYEESEIEPHVSAWKRLLHPDDMPRSLQAVEEVLNGKRDFVMEFRMRHKNGSYVDVLSRGFPVRRGPNGPIVRIVGTHFDLTERNRAEQELRESRLEYLGVIENTSAIIMRLSPTGIITFANQRAQDFFGYSAEELIGRQVLETIVPPQESTGRDLAEMVGRIIAEPDAFHTNANENICKDGRRVWLEWTNSGIYGTDGRLKECLSVGIDVTDRKQAEEALRRREEEYRSIVETANEGILLGDAKGKITFVNQKMADMLGYTREELIGQTGTDLLADGQLQQVLANRQALESGQPLQSEICFRRKDGTLLWTLTSTAAILDQQGAHLANLAMHTDITERKRAEAALLESEARYRALIQYAPTGICEIDYRARSFVSINDALCRMSGYTRDELVALGPAALLSVENRKRFARHIRRQLAGEPIHPEAEYRLRRKDGSVRNVVVNMAFSKERPWIATVILHDVTERKQAEAAIRQSQKTFWELIERAPFGIFVVDSQLRIAHMNTGSQKGTFRNVRPVIKRELAEALHILWPEPVAAEIISQVRKTLDTGEPYVSPRFVNPRRDVDIIESYEWELHRIMLPAGQYGVICYYFNSTKLREAEEALRFSEARFRLLSETASRLLVEKSPQQAIENLCKQVMVFLNCQVFFNFLDLRQEGRLHLNAYAGIPEGEARKIALLDYGAAICGCTAQEKRRLVAQDIFNNPDPRTDLVKSYGVQAYACLPLMAGDRFLGTLSFGTTRRTSFTDAELDLMKTVADQVAMGLEREDLLDTLEQRVQERTAEVEQAWKTLRELTAKLIAAEELQRKETAQEIHDTLGSSLSGIKYKLEDLIEQIAKADPGSAWQLNDLIPWIQAAIKDCRRIQTHLRPTMLTELGLLATIAWFVRQYENLYPQITVTKNLEVEEKEIPEHLKIVIYRVLQEAFNNTAKHSGTDRVLLRLVKDQRGLLLTVTDYGRGFIPEEVKGVLGESGGLGLSSMKERVEGSGGEFKLHSVGNQGTTISARWPLAEVLDR